MTNLEERSLAKQGELERENTSLRAANAALTKAAVESEAELQRVIDECNRVTKERDEALRHPRNLLAVIHRDGGHYTAEHGYEKSCKDAEAIVLEDRRERDEARAERDRMRDTLVFVQATVAPLQAEATLITRLLVPNVVSEPNAKPEPNAKGVSAERLHCGCWPDRVGMDGPCMDSFHTLKWNQLTEKDVED